MRVQKAVSTNGFRLHEASANCWCRPQPDPDEPDVLVHRCQCAWQLDDRPRMTVYSDALAQL